MTKTLFQTTLLGLFFASSVSAGPVIVFSDDFEGARPADISGVWALNNGEYWEEAQ